jgi:hypothetical protein
MRYHAKLTALIGLLAASACADPTPLALRGGVAVSFSTRAPAPPPAPIGFAPRAMLDDTIVQGTDTLIITRARIVLREIELKRLETIDCTGDSIVGCEEVELGPVLVDLPLDVGAQQQFDIEIPTGTYSRIDFEIHKVGDSDPADLAFRQAHPEFTDISMRVEGTFNSQAFLFVSDLDVEQELDLVPALVVDSTTNTNVTIFVDLDAWFRSASGTLVDPATANKGGQNEGLVKENIKQSLKAFEDPDRDGLD